MFFYFIIFIAIGFFLGFFKIEDEQKYGIALVISIIWGIAFHPVWGIVSLMELALGLYLSTLLLQKNKNIDSIVTETLEEDNISELSTSPLLDNDMSQFLESNDIDETYIQEWSDIPDTELDKYNPTEASPMNLDEDTYLPTGCREIETLDAQDSEKYIALEEAVNELNERIIEMESYIAQLEFENERLLMESNS